MKTGWNGVGEGTVDVEAIDDATWLFREKGVWTALDGAQNDFTNVYRWSVDWEREHIRLEHLRFGLTNPVYLFNLVMDLGCSLKSENPHVCSEDLYSALMTYDAKCVLLSWAITGPRKNLKITYRYT